jgi:hypothetical protein
VCVCAKLVRLVCKQDPTENSLRTEVGRFWLKIVPNGKFWSDSVTIYCGIIII